MTHTNWSSNLTTMLDGRGLSETTEQDRAEFEAWKEDYALTFEPNYDEHLGRAAFLAGMQAARRAPVVPQGWKLVPVEPTRAMMSSAVMQAEGDAVYKVATARWLEAEEREYGDAYQAMLAAAPRPPEAAPVQMPEPRIFWIEATTQFCIKRGGEVPFASAWEPLYTEHQVRQILAKHGIK